MQGDVVWFVFYLVGHMLKCGGAVNLENAIAMAADSINVVLDAHNQAVRDVQAGDRTYYRVETGDPYMSDNQCVLLGMLRGDTIYKRIEEHVMVDMGIYPAEVAFSNL
jgi:hypothetical protein